MPAGPGLTSPTGRRDEPALTATSLPERRPARRACPGTYDTGVYYTGLGGKPYSYSSVFMHVYPQNLCPLHPRR